MITETEGEVRGQKKKGVRVGGCTLFYKDDVQLLDELYTNYAEALLDGTVSTKSFLGTMVQQSLQRIAIDSKKDGDTALKALKELQHISHKTQQYFDAKKSIDSDFVEYNIRKGLFPWQRPVFDDSSKKIAVLAGRRAGKSYVMSRIAVKHCITTDVKPRQVVIIGLTIERTAAIYWDTIKTCIQTAHCPVRKIDNGNYTITFSNGNTLQLCGNNSKAEREKLRGFDISMAIVDECQSQSGLLYLTEQILGPQLKGRDGQLLLLGTAPLTAGTYWEMVILSDSVSHYHATMEDNPTIPNYEHALEDVLRDNHWTKDNITFRREYLGEIAYDTERLILPHRTYYEQIPTSFHPTYCYIGVDYGWRDYSSFAPILVDDKGQGYVIDEWKQNRTQASHLVDICKAKVDEIHKKYNIPMEHIYVVADTSHQQISADFFAQGILNVVNAYKQDENYQWARLAEALEMGDLQVQQGGYVDTECDMLVWKWNEERSCVVYQVDDVTFHPDISDSLKYAWNQYIADSRVRT